MRTLVGNENGVVIASRWPLGEVREIELNTTPRSMDFPCSTLLAEGAAPAPIGDVLFVDHVATWQAGFECERELQAVTAAEAIEEYSNQYLERADSGPPGSRHRGGDFDAEPTAASIRFWTGQQSLGGMSVCYQDTWHSARPTEPGYIFTHQNELVDAPDRPRRIDYVLVRYDQTEQPTVGISACRLVLDEPIGGVLASDHFGVLTDLVVPPDDSLRELEPSTV